jgi:hypothetical protein
LFLIGALSSRAEQYVPTMLCFGLFANFDDAIIAAKIFIVVIWMGAGESKLQHGFSYGPFSRAVMITRPHSTARGDIGRLAGPLDWREPGEPDGAGRREVILVVRSQVNVPSCVALVSAARRTPTPTARLRPEDPH